jgi:DNA-binding beta-propeller fold protein YncE
MVYDARNQEVYALDEGSFTKATPGYVSVFSTSHTVVASVKVADRPVTATVDPVNGEVVVVNTGVPNSTTGAYPATTLNVISSLNKLTATVKVGHEGFYAIWSPSTQDFYIPCEQSNATYVLNGTTNLLLSKPLATGQYPVAAFYDPGRGEMLVVGNSNTTGTPTKTVVTLLTSANKVAGTLLLGKGPTGGGAYDPKNSDVYASDEGANELSILH